jgi:hypothetical protein
LIEKIDTLVNCVTVHSTMKAPNTDTPPTSTGRPAATTPPNTNSRRSSVSGMAIASARTRSPSIVSPIGGEDRFGAGEADRDALTLGLAVLVEDELDRLDSFGVLLGAREAHEDQGSSPSVDRSGGADPSDQYDATSSTPRWRRTLR